MVFGHFANDGILAKCSLTDVSTSFIVEVQSARLNQQRFNRDASRNDIRSVFSGFGNDAISAEWRIMLVS